jgi:radical SAM family uncharacterized protein
VNGPARYIGCEHNIVEKNPDTVAIRFALCYPDVYEVGTSHVGSQILYHIINKRNDTYCERFFHPWVDAAELLRGSDLLLASLETRTPLREFHIAGFTLQHELNYPSVLSMLELGGVRLRAAERQADEPLIIAGGPCAVNPEPMAPFFDAFAIGDGEEVIHEILNLLGQHDPPFDTATGKAELLSELDSIEGIYVPSLWPVAKSGGYLVATWRTDGKQAVRRRVVEDLDAAEFPSAPIVPYRESIHDRAQLEISRGCTRGCRFCQAGMIYRPTRERSVETLRAQANEIIAATGYDEISLTSLSCTDYTRIEELMQVLHEDLGDQRVAIGLPSIRVDAFDVKLAERAQRVKKTGLTFAPEAGSQAMRERINKNVTEEDLTGAATAALHAGWHRLKLYFMIGLPEETDEDVLAIAETVTRLVELGRECLGHKSGKLQFNLSVAIFIPKPHTPFQWVAQDTAEDFERKRALLQDHLRSCKQVRLRCHDPQQAVVEAFLSRADRTAADVIEATYRAGAILDPWTEHFDFGRWERAAAEQGIDLEERASAAISLDAELPWGHIDVGVSRQFLLEELEKSRGGILTPDCRLTACHHCGVQEVVSECPAGACK